MTPLQRMFAMSLSIGILVLNAGFIPVRAQPMVGQVEPNAGSWRTWVLTSGSQLRVPPPPDAAASAAELTQLQNLVAQRDNATLDRISFWDAGAPGFRWNGILRDEFAKRGVLTASAPTSRQLSLLNVAIYDATIAAWDSKYAYNRPRPGELDASLATAVSNPASPSYPSEHAAVAGAASTVLAYLYPDDAEALNSRAEEAADSRMLAGVQFPSDVAVGLDLGREVGKLVVERARSDGSAAPWTGTIPTEPGLWSLAGYPDGSAPVAPTLGTWRPWVLESGSVLRPGPPPGPQSEQKRAELDEIKNFPRTFVSNAAAFYWQSPRADWIVLAEDRIAQYHLDTNPPRAARVEALVNVAFFDAAIACWDAKYTYWAARPSQLDPEIKTLFPQPAHPSYPSAHGCASGALGAMLSALLPSDAQYFTNQANEAAISRMWAGIHFRSDIDTGLALGRAVAQRIIARSATDGAQ